MSFNLSDIKNIFDRPKVQPSSAPSDSLINNVTNEEGFLALGEGTYTLESQNWYSAKPYGFKASFRDGKTIIMFLPINPSNLTIATNFATNLIPTLYGTVEEHSEVRYFDISIEGTTGMAPKFVAPFVKDGDMEHKLSPGDAYNSLRKSGRSTFEIASSLSAGGFFAKTLNQFNQIANKASDLISGNKPKTGINPENSGYVAFHNLYRFLLQHKKDAAGARDSQVAFKDNEHPLTFFNYKDNNEYNVVVRSFTMRKSADNPMLYYYSIQLRGYNLRSIKDKVDEDLSKRLQDLGLSGVDSSSILGDIKSISSQAKSILGSAIGGINVLGR
jgi:hypothetical protein